MRGFDVSTLRLSSDDDIDDEEPQFLGDPMMVNAYSDDIDSKTPLFVYQGAVNKHQAVILLDKGANRNYVSKEFAERNGLQQSLLDTPSYAITATGRRTTVTHQVMCADVRVVGVGIRTNLIVVHLA